MSMPEPATAVVQGAALPTSGLPGVRTTARPGPRALRPVSFSPTVVLTKAEAFDACQALADAGGRLVRLGCTEEATTLAGLFELLERRLTDRG
jgi:hypothetical protein